MTSGIYITKDASKTPGWDPPRRVRVFIVLDKENLPQMWGGRWHGVGPMISEITAGLIGLKMESLLCRELQPGEIVWRPLGHAVSKGVFKKTAKVK